MFGQAGWCFRSVMPCTGCFTKRIMMKTVMLSVSKILQQFDKECKRPDIF